MTQYASRDARLDCRSIDYKSIPVQSDIISGILRLDVEADSCFRDLENYVCSDLGVATLVLRVVNSAFYSRGNKIANISKAISVLGFNVVRSLAMLALSRSLFAQSRNPLFQKHIWQHSLLTAIAGQVIYEDVCRGPDGDEAFIAGLMHDVGKVLLFSHAQQRYLKVLSLVLELGRRSIDAEQDVLGCDHIQVGAEAVVQWKLPDRFADFMGVDLAKTRPELSMDPVCLSLAAADALVAMSGIGAKRNPDAAARKSVLTAYGIAPELCERWVQDDFMAGLMENDTYKLCAAL